MKWIALTCSQCGAPQEIPYGSSAAVCEYCSSRLHLERDASSAADASDVLDSGAARKTYAALDQLDREWELYRAKYLERRNDGTYDIPTEEECRYAIGITVVGTILLLLATSFWTPIASVAVFIFSAVILARLAYQKRVGRVYRRSLQNYRHERSRLFEQWKTSEMNDPQLAPKPI